MCVLTRERWEAIEFAVEAHAEIDFNLEALGIDE